MRRPEPSATAAPAPGRAPVRQVLVVNPNTNPAVTRKVRAAAAEFESASLRVDVVNPLRGPFSIETAAEREQAEREAVALIGQRAFSGYDAYVLACFDDLALEAARGLVNVPVVGTCESGLAAAHALSPRYAVVTTFDAALPGIRLLMQRYGASAQATARAAGIGVAAAAAADAEDDAMRRIIDCARAAASEDGAEVILLASGGLTGLGPALSKALSLPVVDGVAAAIGAAVERVRLPQA